MTRKIVVSMLLLGSALSCSKSSGKKGASQNAPSTPDQALARLSPEYRQSYDAWKASLVKGCSATQAFSNFSVDKLEKNQNQNVGVDALLLLNLNSGSFVYSDGEKSAIVTSYQTDYSEETSKLDASVSINGSSSQIVAEARRRGLDCELYVFGQKVFETKLAASLNIGVGIGDKAPSQIDIKGLPKVNVVGQAGLGEFKSPGLTPAIEKELAPAETTRTLVASQLGIPPNLAKRLLTLNPSLISWSSLRMADNNAALWASFNDSSIMAPLDSLRDLVNLDSAKIPLEVRIPMPVLEFGNDSPSKIRGTLPVRMDWEQKKGPESYTYSVLSAKSAEVKAFDAEEASECALNRGHGLFKDSSLTNQITPSVVFMLAPCQILFKDLDSTLLSNGVYKTLIPKVFNGVKPTYSFGYMGWDKVLSDLALKALKEDKNLVSELDPDRRTDLVPSLAAISSQIRELLELSKNLAPEASPLLLMGMNWSFKGIPVSQTSLDEMIRALDNSYLAFKQSTLNLIQTLKENPNSSSAAISYALTLDDTLKNEASKALSLSKDTGYLDFQIKVFDQILQSQVSIDRLRQWSERLTEIKSALSPFSGLDSVKNRLVGATLTWLSNQSVTYGELPQIYAAINNVSEVFPESTKALLESLQSSPKAKPESLTYAAGMTREMKDLVLSIKAQSLDLDLSSLGNSFFNGILQKMAPLEELRQLDGTLSAAKDFKTQETNRVKDHREQVSKNESDLKDLMLVATTELWSKKDFEDIVVISELAQAKNWSCERLLGVSSRLDCADLRLISKAPGKILSPAFSSRYPKLAETFLGYITTLAKKGLLNDGRILASEFFSDPIWSKCDQNAFAEKIAGVDQAMKLIGKETDQFKLWDFERQLKSQLENCR